MAAAYTMHFALPVGDKAMERSDAKYNGTANRLFIAGIHYTCWSQPYNEEKDRKVIEYVEDWLSHIEWTNQDIVG